LELSMAETQRASIIALLSVMLGVAVFTNVVCQPAFSAERRNVVVSTGDWFSPISPQQEIQAGVKMDQQIREKYKPSDNQVLQDYVSTLGKRLARQTQLDYPFTYTVIDDSRSANAFTAPGGFIYVTTGLINMLENESQLAAVLAHETGHVVKRHIVKQLQQKSMTNLAISALSQLSNRNLNNSWTQVGEYLLFQKFSRSDEYDADIEGTRLMVKAGYDPIGMVQLMDKLSSLDERGVVISFLQSHPASKDRGRIVEEYIQRKQLRHSGQILDTHDFHMVVR
jgi:predicted Zn-dependent protease